MRDKLAECFPPGVFLREELEARGWTVANLCQGPGEEEVRAILEDPDHYISLATAEWIANRLGVSAVLLLNLQQSYRQWKRNQP